MTTSRRVLAALTDVALVTVPGVELLEVGEDWVTSTGTFTWDVADLQSAIASQDDPMVRTPVIKLGHVDPRFDGQPTFGRIENMRLTNNDQTLVGDLVGVPKWLAECMPSAFPRRSIEGWFAMSTRSGNTWPFVLTGVALLGAAYPAITCLEDITMLYGTEPPELIPVDEADGIAALQPSDATILVAASTPEARWVAAGATTFQDLPLSDRDVTWSASSAKSNVRDWASSDGSGDTDKIDWTKLRKAYLWYDASDGEKLGSYKLPYADVVNGTLTAIWKGVTAAAGVIQGGRGGVDIPSGDEASVKTHIAKYYTKAATKYGDDTITPPWVDDANASMPVAAKVGHTHAHTHADGTSHAHYHSHNPSNLDHTTSTDVTHTHSHVTATVATDDVRMAFYDGPGGEPGRYWWWIREVDVDPPQLIVDDDEGHLYRIEYTIGTGDGPDAVTFGEPQEVRIQYQDVPAAAVMAARFGNPVAAGRPRVRAASPPTREGRPDVQLTDDQLRALGLEPGATDEQISAALTERLSAAPPPEPAPDPEPPVEPPAPEPPTEPTGVTAPPGTVLVDATQWEETRRDAGAAAQFLRERDEERRNRILDDAVRAGKFPLSRREHWAQLMAGDPDGTTTMIQSLASGLVPVGPERGTQSPDEQQGEQSAYPETWKSVVAAASKASRSRVKVASD